MARINLPRVVVGGVLGGIVCVLLQSFANALGVRFAAAVDRTQPVSWLPGVALAVEVLVAAPLWTWFYAAIRPRLGPGPRTALIAAFWIWLFLVPYTQLVMVGLGALRLLSLRALLWVDLYAFLPIAGALLVGAWVYQEREAASAANA